MTHIYFAEFEEFSRIKIGTSANVTIRLRHLQSLMACTINVLLLTEGSYLQEQEIHGLFRPWKIRNEMFKACPETKKLIKEFKHLDLELDRLKINTKLAKALYADHIRVPNWDSKRRPIIARKAERIKLLHLQLIEAMSK